MSAAGLSGPFRSILVLNKPRYIGDTVVGTPLLRGLRQAFPDAYISMLLGPPAQTVMQGCPYVNAMIPFDPYGKDRGAGAFLKVARSIRQAARPDLCLVINASVGAALMAFLCGARVRIGWATEGRGFLITHPVPHDRQQVEIEAYLDILRAVAPETAALTYSPETELWITSEERAWAATFLQERGVAPGTPLVALHPAAHDPEVREWGIERYARLGDRLVDERGAVVVLLGSAEERERTQKVKDAMTRPSMLLAGETNLRQTMGVIANCRLWVGNDGGMLHTATALGTPTIGIFGPTKARPWGYNSPPHRTLVVYPDEPAAGPSIIRQCLDAISVESVFHAAFEILTDE